MEPFFKRYGDDLRGVTVAAFLLFDRGFPRSVRHNVDRARNFLRRIRPRGRHDFPDRANQRLDSLPGWLDGKDAEELLRNGVHGLVTELVGATAELCDAVHADYFDVFAHPAPRAAG